MRTFYVSSILRMAGVISLLAGVGCSRIEALSESTEDIDVSEISSEYLEQIKEMYEKAKESGEHVPEEVMEWAKADVQRIGTWQYTILNSSTESEEVMVAQLEEMGKLRWECFWVETTSNGRRFYMKKRVRSYVQMVGKATKFIPIPGGGE